MKFLFILVTALPILLSCNQQSRPVTSPTEEALQLEDFDFSTNISTLLPEKTKSKVYSGTYELKSEMLEADTVSDGDYGSETPVRIEYKQQSFSSEDVLAEFAGEEFNAVNLVTAMDGSIMLVNALKDLAGLKQMRTFIETLEKKYGKPVKSKGKFANQDFDLYTWQLNDRIIRYSVVLESEENTLRLEVDENTKKVSEGKKESHYKGYIYILKNEFKDKIFGKVSSGDFVFLE